ncbi:MAG: molybdopterin-dependent oxidoreductase [Chloroflexi bacterium]|nr:molybdopterin-dependent oxidoreductase [Chloroflexota bacterium]
MTRHPRRQFLKLAATAVVAAACAPVTQGAPGATATPAGTVSRPAQSTESPVSSPLGTRTPSPSPRTAPTEIIITETKGLYKQFFATIPHTTADWTLTIDGLVKRPLALNLSDIKALPAIEVMRTLECIGNPVGGPLVGNAVWKGAALKPLFDEAGLAPSAVRAAFEAADEYRTSIDLKYINHPGAFVAYEMNGQPLTPEHGFPLRVFFSGSYGQKMPKWITRIELVDRDVEGYWEARGWSDVAQVQTHAIIKQPAGLSTFALQRIPVWGIANAADVEIVKVEVKIGDDWREAALLHGPTAEVWTQWSLDWTPPAPGRYTVLARATDANGRTQTRADEGVLRGAFPNGTSVIHRVVMKIADG